MSPSAIRLFGWTDQTNHSCTWYFACHTDLSLEDTGNTFGSLDEDNTAIYPLCVTNCSFVANEIGMISFAEGILVFIMNKEGNLWYGRIKHSGREGYFSSDHLEVCTSLYSYGWVRCGTV